MVFVTKTDKDVRVSWIELLWTNQSWNSTLPFLRPMEFSTESAKPSVLLYWMQRPASTDWRTKLLDYHGNIMGPVSVHPPSPDKHLSIECSRGSQDTRGTFRIHPRHTRNILWISVVIWIHSESRQLRKLSSSYAQDIQKHRRRRTILRRLSGVG